MTPVRWRRLDELFAHRSELRPPSEPGFAPTRAEIVERIRRRVAEVEEREAAERAKTGRRVLGRRAAARGSACACRDDCLLP